MPTNLCHLDSRKIKAEKSNMHMGMISTTPQRASNDTKANTINVESSLARRNLPLTTHQSLNKQSDFAQLKVSLDTQARETLSAFPSMQVPFCVFAQK